MKILGRKTVKTEKTSAPMIKTSKPAKSASASGQPLRSPTHEEIAARSYEIYLARGGAPGFAEQDWLQAESELNG